MRDRCVLVIDDDYEFMEDDFSIGLGAYGFRVEGETNSNAALGRIKEEKPDIVLLDILFSQGKLGKGILERIKKSYPKLPVVMITSTMSDDEYDPKDYSLSEFRYAKEALGNGDFTDLAFHLDRLIDVAETNILIEDNDWGLSRFGFIVGKTRAMKQVSQLFEKVAESNDAVLITGESGTGKELAARAVHQLSRRNDKPFLAVSCVAIPRELLESELFGIEKGVATGVDKRIGKIEQADGGTLFLDEIGDIPKDIQTKLLRFLQEKRFCRVGGKTEMESDVRIISATLRNLERLKSDDKFREDLYFRINVLPIHIPPLRERKEDLTILFKHFVNKSNEHSRKKILPILRNDVRDVLFAYSWPGNIRELENIIRYAVAIADENILQVVNFPLLTPKEVEVHSIPKVVCDDIDRVFSGELDWNDISGWPIRKEILLKIIDRIWEEKGSRPSSNQLAKILSISPGNLRRILSEVGIKLTTLGLKELR